MFPVKVRDCSSGSWRAVELPACASRWGCILKLSQPRQPDPGYEADGLVASDSLRQQAGLEEQLKRNDCFLNKSS